MKSTFNPVEMAGPISTRVESPYLTILLDTLDSHLRYQQCPVGKRITISAAHQPNCYIIRKGALSLYRQPDDILIELIEAPTLRGIIPVHESSRSIHILRVIEPAEIVTLNKEDLYALLTEHNLWEPYARHLQLIASMAAEVLFKLVSPTVFEQVRYQLFELMSKPQTLRESITAENYIRGKTRLSRSAVMNVLSALKAGGYITILNGHLKEIKHIPAQF